MKLPAAVVVLAFGFVTTACAAATTDAGYRVLDRYRIGGAGGWDYLNIDPVARHLFVSRGDRVVVMNADTGKVVGEIPGTDGVHGIAIAPDLGRGYTSNGRANTVTVFDLASLKVLDTIRVTGENPDAILYDPASKRVFTFNGRSSNATAIDAASGKVVATIALAGKPEFAVSNGRDRVYVNIEDKSELSEIDPVAGKVIATWSLAPGEEPSGLAIDTANNRLFAVCQNRQMIVLDAQNGTRVASVPIGEGPDAAAFDAARNLAFSSNGRSGTLTVIHEDDAGHFRVVENATTQQSARTMTLDPQTHRIFLSAAEFGPVPQVKAPKMRMRPPMIADSFTVLVVGK